jgi:hypothetical protein
VRSGSFSGTSCPLVTTTCRASGLRTSQPRWPLNRAPPTIASDEGDPEHHNLKARNLGALWPAFHVRVDTGGLSVAESATQILRTAGDWPGVS